MDLPTPDQSRKPILPAKRLYRQRAHVNPLHDWHMPYPTNPESMDWKPYFPQMKETDKVSFLDIGCGYGGLSIALASRFKEKYILGMEIRKTVTEYVQERVNALRAGNFSATGLTCATDTNVPTSDQAVDKSHDYRNVGVIYTNAMKYLPNYFAKGSIEKMFFLYPDPHFKKRKFKQRIIRPQLLAEYAYILAVGGRLYIATDVESLFLWMSGFLNQHPLFRKVEDGDATHLIMTEEAQKATREGRGQWEAVYERIVGPREPSPNM